MTEAFTRLGLAAVLTLFVAVGVTLMFNPDWFVRRPLQWKDGEMLRTWNRDSMRVGGAVFAAVAVWMLYHVLFDWAGR